MKRRGQPIIREFQVPVAFAAYWSTLPCGRFELAAETARGEGSIVRRNGEGGARELNQSAILGLCVP